MSPKRIWITWETQRRSVELAKHFGCKLFIIEHSGVSRYLKCILKTLIILRCEKPDLLFVQNPSMILAKLACLYQVITRTPVVVDRHTTFGLGRLGRKYPLRYLPRVMVFKILHRLTIKLARMTIVTNDFLAGIVKSLGGYPAVLPDKLPDLAFSRRIELKGKFNLLLISSFGFDEPVAEVVEALGKFNPEDVCLYISGNYKKLDNTEIVAGAPQNVVFTGFIAEQDFVDMLYSVEAVVVLTKSDYCMLCGCYEAVSAGKALVTSDKLVLREYFKDAVFVDNTVDGIYKGIIKVCANIKIHTQKAKEMKNRLHIRWEALYLKLETQISEITN